MGFWNKIFNRNSIVTRNGRVYEKVDDTDIPEWVKKKGYQMEGRGETTMSVKGKKYRYIIKYVGGGYFDYWKRKRNNRKTSIV